MVKQRGTIMLTILVLGLGAVAAPVAAGDPNAKQAREELEFGYKAAKRGYWQEALERFRIADELTPNQPRILNNIAVALEANGRFDEARETYRAGLALDPGNSALTRNLERLEEFYATHVKGPEEDPETEPGASAGAAEGGDDGP